MDKNETVTQEASSQNEIIDSIIEKINSNNFTIYFYCPPLNQPSGGIGVLLKQAKLLKDAGFKIKVIYEPTIDEKASYEVSVKEKKKVEIFQKFSPAWLDFSIADLEFEPLGDKEIRFTDKTTFACKPLQLLAEDFLIIPEGFPDVMKRTMQTPCKRIVLAQSWFYVLNSMNLGEKWQHFGIKDVIVASEAIEEYLNAIMPGLSIKKFSPSIDRNTFKAPTNKSDKFPIIAYSSNRGPENQMKTFNILKTFHAFYPHYNWLRFVPLSNLSRQEFAERLASAAIVLYTDEIAGFGTLPLEAMACNTTVVGWASYGGKEYMNTNNGFWATNGDIFQAAELLGVAVDRWIAGELDNPAVRENYEVTLSKYTPEKEKESILKIYQEYKTERINELNSVKN